jgi:hypothetical protein
MKRHSPSAVSVKNQELSALVSSLQKALAGTEVTGAELNKRHGYEGAQFHDSAVWCEVDPSKVRLATDYLSAFLRELKREFGK